MNTMFSSVLLVTTIATAIAQYDQNYGSRDQDYNRQRPTEQSRQQNWMKACERFSCPHPQVCRTTRGVPGCFDDPAGSHLTHEHHAPPEPEVTAERTDPLQTYNSHRPPQGYGTTPQFRHQESYGATQGPLYPNLHPTQWPSRNRPDVITTPQPYHRGGYPQQQPQPGGYQQGYQQYYPGYPYQQNYGNFYPNQQVGYPSGNYGYQLTPQYPSRQPEYSRIGG